MRTLNCMSKHTDELITVVNQAISHSNSYAQRIASAVTTVITVEHDLRFIEQTLTSVLEQTCLPARIIIADCTGQIIEPQTLTLQVHYQDIASSLSLYAQQSISDQVDIQIVPVSGARSFMHAVGKVLGYANPSNTTRALWLLHDDSRAEKECLDRLVDTWHTATSAWLIGAKQLDWDSQALHNVGYYGYKHGVASLVVEGELDQEQYDTRQDVYAVSLAGALVPLQTLQRVGGFDQWLSTYEQGFDFGRRICAASGRVVVVPQARIHHRRARSCGLRTRSGYALESQQTRSSQHDIMLAQARLKTTDIPVLLWPLLWLASLVLALPKSVYRLFTKRPMLALYEITLPWHMLMHITKMSKVRSRLTAHTKRTRRDLVVLYASREQIARYHERVRIARGSSDANILDPLARQHLHMRAVRRWSIVLISTLAVLCYEIIAYWPLVRTMFSGSIASDIWVPTASSYSQLAQSATTLWAYGVTTGSPAPPTPLLLPLLVAATFTGGKVSLAINCIIVLSVPVSVLTMWALAGIFTRSDFVRTSVALLWASFAFGAGFVANAHVPMLIVMALLPACFAFVFRAVGVYHTEAPVKPHASIQSAAIAALCFIPVLAASPQLLLALVVAFIVFMIVVPRHRAMLLLIPLPSALLLAPTLMHSIMYASQGSWRQLFGMLTVPNNEAGAQAGMLNILLHAITGQSSFSQLSTPQLVGVIVACVGMIILFVGALISLALPFALRASRLMWVVSVTGAALACVSVHVAISNDIDGIVYGSAFPGLMLCLLGILSCVCLVAGPAIKRFAPLLQGINGKAVSGNHAASSPAITISRAILVGLVLALAVSFTTLGLLRNQSDAFVSTTQLPMAAQEYVSANPNRRVLALQAVSSDKVKYAPMRTARGDMIDESVASRARTVSGQSPVNDETLAMAAAQLLANADNQAIENIASLGFGGIFVPNSDNAVQQSATDELVSHISASNGVQTVVSNREGTYIRITIADAQTLALDSSQQTTIEHSVWRKAWLITLGVVIALYCIVALPRTKAMGRNNE